MLRANTPERLHADPEVAMAAKGKPFTVTLLVTIEGAWTAPDSVVFVSVSLDTSVQVGPSLYCRNREPSDASTLIRNALELCGSCTASVRAVTEPNPVSVTSSFANENINDLMLVLAATWPI